MNCDGRHVAEVIVVGEGNDERLVILEGDAHYVFERVGRGRLAVPHVKHPLLPEQQLAPQFATKDIDFAHVVLLGPEG